MLETLMNFLREIFFFTGYVGKGGSFPPQLSEAEEAEYICGLQEKDSVAQAKLIEHNLRLVAHIAKKYINPHRDVDDLISIGTIGLIKAVSTFDPDKGNTLATYASKCIENEILMSLRLEKKQVGEVSISESIGIDKDGNEISLGDVLGSDPDAIHEHAAMRIASAELRKAMLRILDAREQEVIRLRYGLENGLPLPQREVAIILGISRSYVSRLEKKAVQKLTAELFCE